MRPMTASARARFEAAYLATTYRVLGPRSAIDLRIGRRAPALDRLLHALGIREWAFVSACNPASRALPRWRNRIRQTRLHRSLLSLLGQAGVVLPGLGVPDAPDWRPEPSFLAMPVGRGRARRLGRQFGQHAVVAGRRGRRATLVWTAP